MKKITLLLNTVICLAVLSGCNSGASGASTPNSTNLATLNESSVKSTQDTSFGHNIGLVVTNDKNLDFYKDDKFISTVWKFEDQPTSVRIASVGDLATNKPFVAYVTTKIRGFIGRGGILKKCTAAPLSGDGMDCVTIDRFNDTVYAANLDENGNGYTINVGDALSTVSKYANNQLIDYKFVQGWLLSSYNGSLEVYNDTLYFVNGGRLLKYNFGEKQDTVTEFNKGLASLSVDKDLNGYGNDDYSLYHMLAGSNLEKVHTFEDRITNISSTGSWIYVVTDGNELKKCDTGGDCSTIDTFGSTPTGVSFRAL